MVNTVQKLKIEYMRKRHIMPLRPFAPSDREHRLDLSTTALVEVTSEEQDYPVESALIPGESKGWRAAEPGTQTIRPIFDRQQKLKRISLVFEETKTSRTQEFVLRWSAEREGTATDSAPAMEFQSTTYHNRGRRLSRRHLRGQCP